MNSLCFLLLFIVVNICSAQWPISGETGIRFRKFTPEELEMDLRMLKMPPKCFNGNTDLAMGFLHYQGLNFLVYCRKKAKIIKTRIRISKQTIPTEIVYERFSFTYSNQEKNAISLSDKEEFELQENNFEMNTEFGPKGITKYSGLAYYDLSPSGPYNIQERLDTLVFLHFGSCHRPALFSENVPAATFHLKFDKLQLEVSMSSDRTEDYIDLGDHSIVTYPDDQVTGCILRYYVQTRKFSCFTIPIEGSWSIKDSYDYTGYLEDKNNHDNELATVMKGGLPLIAFEQKIREMSIALDRERAARMSKKWFSSKITPPVGVFLLGRKRLFKLTSTNRKCKRKSGILTYLVKIEAFVDEFIDEEPHMCSWYYDGEKFFDPSDWSDQFGLAEFTVWGHEMPEEDFDHILHYVDVNDAKIWLRKVGRDLKSDCHEETCKFVLVEPIAEKSEDRFVRDLCNGNDLAMYIRAPVLSKEGMFGRGMGFLDASIVSFTKDGMTADTQGTGKILAVNLDAVGLYNQSHFLELK